MRPCFSFKNIADPVAAELSIYDEIGMWGVQASDFRAQLSSVQAPAINLEINSPGGDVFAGIAMYNMLKMSGKTINVKVMGVAASAASLIAMAGDTITMPKNSFMMVHNPITGVYGNAEDLRASADVLDKIGNSITATYMAKTGMAEDAMKALLAVDTWLTADEALKMGFATAVTDPIEAQAAFDMTRADLPENVKAVFEAAAVPPVVEQPVVSIAMSVREATEAAGLPEYAAHFALSCDSLEACTARIVAAKEITVLCGMAERPADAAVFIRASKSVADTRIALMAALAAEDVHVDATKPIIPPNPAGAGLNQKEVYAARNQPKATK